MWLGYNLSGRVPMTVAAQRFMAATEDKRKTLIADVTKFQSQPYTFMPCGVPAFLDTVARRLRAQQEHDERAEVDFSTATQVVFNCFENTVQDESLGSCSNPYTLLEFYESGKGVEFRAVVGSIIENQQLIERVVTSRPSTGHPNLLLHAALMLDDIDFSLYIEVWTMGLDPADKSGKANIDALAEERKKYKTLYTRIRKGEPVASIPKIELPHPIKQYSGWQSFPDFNDFIREKLNARLLSCMCHILDSAHSA